MLIKLLKLKIWSNGLYSFITLCCLFGAVIPPAVLNIIAYPISRRWSCAISQYIVKVLAPRVFAILNCYRHFSFFGYSDSKKMLKFFVIIYPREMEELIIIL